MSRRLALLTLLACGPAAVTAPVPKAGPADGVLFVVTSDGVSRLLTPDGKEVKRWEGKGADTRYTFARLSPDRTTVALARRTDANTVAVALTLRTLDTGETKDLTDFQHLDRLFWSADGATVYASGLDMEAGKDANKKRHECWLSFAVDAKTGKAKPLALGGEYRVAGLTADGKSLFTLRTFGQRVVGKGVWGPELEAYRTDPATMKHTKFVESDAGFTPLVPFPDGRRWLVQTEEAKPWVRVYTPADKSLADIPGWSDDGVLNRTLRLAPDGKRLAFVRTVTAGGAVVRWELVVAGLDGKEADVLLEVKPPDTIRAMDWR